MCRRERPPWPFRHVPAVGDRTPLVGFEEALRHALAFGIGAGQRHHRRQIAALRGVEKERRRLVDVEQLRFGIAVDVEAEQELGPRVALLGEELQLLLGRHGIACLQGLDRFLHAGGGGLCGEQQGGHGDGQGGADETNEMHGRGLREARPVLAERRIV
jgi:hypothetical protein